MFSVQISIIPLLSVSNKTNNLLNKTHVNTNERIIRKNLLFSAGDTISPLTLSDNERILRDLPFINDAQDNGGACIRLRSRYYCNHKGCLFARSAV